MHATKVDHRLTIRFRLRTLMLLAGVAACLFAGPAWYDYLYRAKITPLTDAEAEALNLFGATPVREITPADQPTRGERFIAEYRPRYSSIRRITAAAERTTGLTNYFASYENSRALIKAEQVETVQRFFEAFQHADTPNPRQWVMRGVVVDAGDQPAARVMVDLIGGYNEINSCQSRDDGTFAHVVDFAGNPPSRRYQSRFRIRSLDGHLRYTTAAFTITGGGEQQVRITLPVKLVSGDQPVAAEADNRSP